MELKRSVSSQMHFGNTHGRLTSVLYASLQVNDEEPEDAVNLSTMKAGLSASIKALILSSLAAADDASDLAVATLEAYGYKDVTSLKEYGGLGYFKSEYLCAAYSGDCLLLVDFYASNYSSYNLNSAAAEELLKSIQELRQVASFHFDKGG